ncbi:hypothetical protein E2C01_049988 [Portunus trituberculatus]|uniref:Uncharacterized protein n=1 Tax=Portunus trituberculatus TaxID=210409 RepID=A0A5B7GEW3_PORTR|nr:hypothetical protein [Portunus trituberculatus]
MARASVYLLFSSTAMISVTGRQHLHRSPYLFHFYWNIFVIRSSSPDIYASFPPLPNKRTIVPLFITLVILSLLAAFHQPLILKSIKPFNISVSLTYLYTF